MGRALTNRLLLSDPQADTQPFPPRPIDVYTQFGVYLNEDCLKEVVNMPSYRTSSIQTKSWAEYDGIDVDISEPVLDARTIKLQFHCSRSHSGSDSATAFVDYLVQKTYYRFFFAIIQYNIILRYVSSQSLVWNSAFDTFTLTFAVDNPTVADTSPSEPTSLQGTLKMDNSYFASFGCMELKGTKAAFNKLEAVKERLKVSRDTIDGVWYDEDGTNKIQYPDIAIPLHMRPSSITHFWSNWNGLFTGLTKFNLDGQAIRVISDGVKDVECYYKKCAVNKFKMLNDGSVWVDFTLTFAVISKSLVTT